MRNNIRQALLLIALLATGSVANAAMRTTYAGASVEHLYVGANPVLRFLVRNGVPAAHPGRSYARVGPPFAADAAGNFYATVNDNSLGFAVYSADSNRATRSVLLQFEGKPFGQQVFGLAADTYGNTYISLFYSWSARPFSEAAGGALGQCWSQSWCTLVYDASAHGYASPFAGVSNATAILQQLAVPRPGVLYGINTDETSGCSASVQMVTHVLQKPRLAATLCSWAITQPAGIAVDPTGDVYVANLGPNQPYIAVFAPNIRNNAKPLHILYPPTSDQSWTGAVAVDSRYLYVGGNPGVVVYDRLAHGRAQPVAALTLSSATYGVAIGP